MTERLFRTAIHEAGHAIMAIDLGVEVYEASIVPRDEKSTIGHVSHKNVRHYPILDYAIAMAGPFAERLFFGELDGHCWGDIDLADEIVEDRLVDGANVEKVKVEFQAFERVVESKLDGLRVKIERLAQELLVRKTMTGDEIKELAA